MPRRFCDGGRCGVWTQQRRQRARQASQWPPVLGGARRGGTAVGSRPALAWGFWSGAAGHLYQGAPPPPPGGSGVRGGAAGGQRPRLGPSRNQLVARHPRGTGATQRGQSLPRGGGTRPARPAQPSGGRAARTRTGRYGRQTGRPTRTAALTPARHGAARWEPPPSCASWNRRGAHREEPTASGTGGVGGGVAAAKHRSWTAAGGGACISTGRGI